MPMLSKKATTETSMFQLIATGIPDIKNMGTIITIIAMIMTVMG